MSKIMIIDDDVELAENMAAILADEGHNVNVLYTTERAIDRLIEEKPDLAILDVMFPDNPAGGFDCARSIRHTPEIKDMPILMLTALNQHFPMDFSGDDIDPDWMPVQRFVEKPLDFGQLIREVEALLEGPWPESCKS